MPPQGAEEECGRKPFIICKGDSLLDSTIMERNKKLKENSQKLRKQLTKEEAKLWYQFLCRYSLPFRRQYIIGNYIVDFYCHQAKLVVELDGSQHYDPAEREKDQIRTAYLEQQGLRVLRFSNLDVLRQFQNVCTVIDRAAKERKEEVE